MDASTKRMRILQMLLDRVAGGVSWIYRLAKKASPHSLYNIPSDGCHFIVAQVVVLISQAVLLYASGFPPQVFQPAGGAVTTRLLRARVRSIFVVQ